jgi:hypothetical protein
VAEESLSGSRERHGAGCFHTVYAKARIGVNKLPGVVAALSPTLSIHHCGERRSWARRSKRLDLWLDVPNATARAAADEVDVSAWRCTAPTTSATQAQEDGSGEN